MFSSKCSPKSDDVYRYKVQSFEDKLMELNKRTCITHKSMEINQCQNNIKNSFNDLQNNKQEQPRVLPAEEGVV